MTLLWRLILLFLSSDLIVLGKSDADFGKRDLQRLTGAELASLVSTQDASRNLDPTNPSSHLSKILIPRAPNTSNSSLVRRHIISTFRRLNWDVEEDTFTEKTPYGAAKFTNIIATKDPKAATKLVLSAHYDSKFFPRYPDNQFVGATDSAAPCAILLDLAQSLDPLLERRGSRPDSVDKSGENSPTVHTTLQIIFFDGEEAYKVWTATDSKYGSRHLAEKWANTYVNPHPARRLNPPGTMLSTIEHLILLDLLGAPNPFIPSYFPSTAWMFDALIAIESRLEQSGHLKPPKGGKESLGVDRPAEQARGFRSFFKPRQSALESNGWIDDDHMPFLHQGVSTLHIIPLPFPKVWHTLKDDASALDLPTMRRWNLIFRVFVAEYLNLRPATTFGPPRREDLLQR